jgi:hypothetical protein
MTMTAQLIQIEASDPEATSGVTCPHWLYHSLC